MCLDLVCDVAERQALSVSFIQQRSIGLYSTIHCGSDLLWNIWPWNIMPLFCFVQLRTLFGLWSWFLWHTMHLDINLKKYVHRLHQQISRAPIFTSKCKHSQYNSISRAPILTSKLKQFISVLIIKLPQLRWTELCTSCIKANIPASISTNVYLLTAPRERLLECIFHF